MINFQEFLGVTHRKQISINRNGEFELPKVLYLDPDWSFMEFLIAASQRLDIVPSATRAFNVNGVEINDCMMIEDDDRLFFSQQESFYAPKIKRETRPPSALDGDLESIEGSKRANLLLDVVGPYDVGDLLGKGGFGEVREGTNQLSGEKVALKFLRRSEIQSMGAVNRTANEINCLATLKHRNIIKLYMHMETPKFIVLAFELMRGGDLLQYLCKRGSTAAEASLDEEEARNVFRQVVAGISFAHNQHIIHRDLKLENLLLLDDSLNNLKIADFGLSEFYRPGGTLSSAIGTLSFQAPEMFSNTNYAGPPIDIWSLGVILFAILCGRLPFEGTDISGSKKPRDAIIKSKIMKCQYKIDDTLTSDAKDILRRMLKLDPSARASIPEIVGHNWMRQDLYNKRPSQAILLPLTAVTAPVTATSSEHLPSLHATDTVSLPRAESESIFEGGKTQPCIAPTDRTADCTNNPTPDESLRPPDSREGRERANHVVDSAARCLKCDASDNLSVYFSSDGEPLVNSTEINVACSSSSKSHRTDLPFVQGNNSGGSLKMPWPLLELSPLRQRQSEIESESEQNISPLASARRTARGSPSQSPLPSPRNLITPDRSSSTGRRVRSDEDVPSDIAYLDPDPSSLTGLLRSKSRRGNFSKCRSTSGFMHVETSKSIDDLNRAATARPLNGSTETVKRDTLRPKAKEDIQAEMFKLVPLKRRTSLAKSPSTVKNYNSDSEESAVSAPCQHTSSVPESQLRSTTAAAAVVGRELIGSTVQGGVPKVKAHTVSKADFGHTVPAVSNIGLDEGYRSAGELRQHRLSVSRAAGTGGVSVPSSRGQRSVLRALNSEGDIITKTRAAGVIGDRNETSKFRGSLHPERPRDGRRPSLEKAKDVEVVGHGVARSLSALTTDYPRKEEYGTRGTEPGPRSPQIRENSEEGHKGSGKGYSGLLGQA